MSAEVDLIWIGAGEPPHWPLGRTIRSAAQPAALAECIARELPQSRAEAWLFWGPNAGAPDPEGIPKSWSGPATSGTRVCGSA